MIIDPRTIINLTRELITALKENTDAVTEFTRELKTLEVKQDALDLEIGSHHTPEAKS